MTPDRHNAIQNLNYYVRPDPPLFSLPSTFKCIVHTQPTTVRTSGEIILGSIQNKRIIFTVHRNKLQVPVLNQRMCLKKVKFDADRLVTKACSLHRKTNIIQNMTQKITF